MPEIIVFAGPNGSGKSTVTKMAKIIEPYINADDIQRTLSCDNMQAAVTADELRNSFIDQGKGFTFETVLSTDRNLKLLQRAKAKGFFIRCVYVLTKNPRINLIRVLGRKEAGGHDVPKDKIVSRFHKAMRLIPELVKVCDIIHIYDNSHMPFRIFKKHKTHYYYWENTFWQKEEIAALTQAGDLQRRIDIDPEAERRSCAKQCADNSCAAKYP